MSNENGSKIHIFEIFRLITPALVTISVFLGGILLSKINTIESRIFTHLTNDEIHAPRSTYVTKAEWDLQTKFLENYFSSIQKSIEDLKCDIKYLIEKKL